MPASETHRKHDVKSALDQFETCLVKPVIAGELLTWTDELRESWAEARQQVYEQVAEIHPRQYQEISAQDPALLPTIEKLQATDNKLHEDCASFDRSLCRFEEQAPKFEPDEERITRHIQTLVDEGIELVTRIRKQEVTVQTWFIEAYTRDRGVGD